jgi:hypothetical protein
VNAFRRVRAHFFLFHSRLEADQARIDF